MRFLKEMPYRFGLDDVAHHHHLSSELMSWGGRASAVVRNAL